MLFELKNPFSYFWISRRYELIWISVGHKKKIDLPPKEQADLHLFAFKSQKSAKLQSSLTRHSVIKSNIDCVILIIDLTKCCTAIHNVSCDTFGAKIGRWITATLVLKYLYIFWPFLFATLYSVHCWVLWKHKVFWKFRQNSCWFLSDFERERSNDIKNRFADCQLF